MKRFEKSTITLISIITVATIIFVVAMILFNKGNQKMISSQNSEYLEDATNRMATNIDAEIQAGYDNIRIVANLISDNRIDAEVDVAQLRELMENSVFDFIEFADTEGWDHTVMNTKTFAGDRKYYVEGVKQGKIGMEVVYNSRATHETLLMFYAPVHYKNEIIGAVIGVYQAANKITKLLTADYFGEKSLAFLATPEGRIVASSEGYDPAAENYLESLPEGGCHVTLENSGWHLAQYFPEKATTSMVTKTNAMGYLLTGIFFLVYIIILVTIIVYLRRRHSQHQKELQEALDKAEVANRSKTDFLFNMSHDIRTPMNAIIGYTSMAKKYIENNTQIDDYLGKIGMAGNTLLNLINQVLDMSRIEAGKIVLTEEPADVVDKAYEMTEIMSHSASVKNIEIKTIIDNVKNRKVYADGGRMNQVILNILGNAIKYTPENGKITYTLSQQKSSKQGWGLYSIIIEDTGIGMSKEYIDTIFEPFSRENTSTVSQIQGTGLGMAIVKKLVDLMGGNIAIESEQGKGTKISVAISLRLQEQSKDNDQQPAINDEVIKLDKLSGKRVLLVEDNEMNREIATMILEEHEMIVETAEDGDIAVEKIQELAKSGDLNHFDAILMDIQMPRMNGYEATRIIRETVPDLKTPIIAVSANAFEEDKQKSLEIGMNGHIAKPIDVAELMHTMMQFL